MTLSILYRGHLESCNNGCEYCPFAKKREGRAALARDRDALARFVAWVAKETARPQSIFFTPWGEALVRRWYRDAITTLSHLSHVRRVAIQTNLSAPLGFLERVNRDKVALWCTYHPEWVGRPRFLDKIRQLDSLGVRHSVGVVGMRRFIPEIQALRAEVPASTYVWVNAVKSYGGGEGYTKEDLATLREVDPLFDVNLRAHPSRGDACRTGETVVSVDGEGVVRRCHFVREPIADLYQPGSLDRALAPRPCPNESCGCHIGYVHLEELALYAAFGDGVLERAPSGGLLQLRRAANARSSNRCGSSPSLVTPLR